MNRSKIRVRSKKGLDLKKGVRWICVQKPNKSRELSVKRARHKKVSKDYKRSQGRKRKTAKSSSPSSGL
jgi:hypothetical protein